VNQPHAPRLEEATEIAVVDTEHVADARLTDVDLSGDQRRGLRLRDVVIQRGNLANLAAQEAIITRVAIQGARLTGVDLTRAKLSDVSFRDCLVELATLAGATLERVSFERCRLAQADFREALWRSVRLEDCDVTEADLTGLRIDGCELRGCTLDAVVGLERLRGAAMPWADIVGHAAVFAATLGIRVIDESEPAARSKRA
jgi:uncharacterized protein YjbI with pentapeptide repeats